MTRTGASPPYVVAMDASGRSVSVWSVARLKFDQKPTWQTALVADLRVALEGLHFQRGEILSATFTSPDTSSVDVENVLFYNVGSAAFARTPQTLRFERAFDDPAPPPMDLSGPANYLHSYACAAPDAPPGHWRRLGSAFAQWRGVTPAKVTGDRASWHVWAATCAAVDAGSAEGSREALASADQFGISIDVEVPRKLAVTPVAAVKGVVDGIVAAYQRFDPSPRVAEVGQLLSEEFARFPAPPSVDALDRYLTYDAKRIFAQPPFNARGRLAIAPADDACVLGTVAVRHSGVERVTLAGEMFSVSRVP